MGNRNRKLVKNQQSVDKTKIDCTKPEYEVITDGYWAHIFSLKYSRIEHPGKWMYYTKPGDFESAFKLCENAVKLGVCTEAKCSEFTNVCCFYCEATDYSQHKSIISYFIENNMIRKTKDGRYYNISYKLDEQTYANEYGDKYVPCLKLGDIIDLYTGEFLLS